MFWTKDKKHIKGKGFTTEEETIRKQTSKENFSMIVILFGWILWILAYIFLVRPYILYFWFEKFNIPKYYALVDFALILFVGLIGMSIVAWVIGLLKK